MNFLNNLRFRSKIFLIIFPISFVAFYGLTIFILGVYDEWTRTQELNLANQASDYILSAAGDQAKERGFASAVAANPNDKVTLEKIKVLRQRSDLKADSALAIAKQSSKNNKLIESSIHSVNSARASRDSMRKYLDGYLGISKVEPIIISTWITLQTDLIMRENALIKSLFQPKTKIEAMLGMNTELKSSIFYASEFAGRERANIGAVIGAGTPIEPERLANLMKFRGVVEENMKIIIEFEKSAAITPPIFDAIEAMKKEFFEDFDKVRQSVYLASKKGEPYPILTSEWIQQSTVGINSILKVSETITSEVKRIAQDERELSIRQMITSIIVLLFLLSAVILSIWLSRLITKLMEGLSMVSTQVMSGNLEVRAEVRTGDEIGKFTESFNAMIANAAKDKDLSEKVAANEKYLNGSVNQLLKEMSKFAQGNLTVSLPEDGKGDIIGELFIGFNLSVQNIRSIISSVVESVHAVASASAEISATTEQMSRGSLQQSQQISGISASISEMTETSMDNAQNCSHAAENARSTGNEAQNGGKIVMQTVNEINTLSEVVMQVAEKIENLGKSSDQIGEIASVINDIADQTNLLALNAAIEAARAGEHGRGFSVVADEVRKLAERTQKSTKEISKMISTIQSETASAVASMQKGTKQVVKGKELSVQAGNSLQSIIERTFQLSDLISQIATASEEQSHTNHSISSNIETVCAVTIETATATEQIAKTTEDLNRLTEHLTVLASRFIIEDNSTVVYAPKRNYSNPKM